VQILIHRFFDQANYQHVMKGFSALGPHWDMVAEERRAPYQYLANKLFIPLKKPVPPESLGTL
jgi:hypothetical protein